MLGQLLHVGQLLDIRCLVRYEVLGYQVLGYQVLGYQVLGYQVLRYQVLRYQVLGYQVLINGVLQDEYSAPRFIPEGQFAPTVSRFP